MSSARRRRCSSRASGAPRHQPGHERVRRRRPLSHRLLDGRPVKTQLLALCEQLADIAARHGAWVRLHYVYPYPHVDDVLPLMATGRILPYLDVPFQHSHPDVLRRMKRPASGEKNLERLARWREICPELVVRSTFIAGFPGETDAEFEHLLDFMREARIDRAGCFAYSPVSGASANALPGMVRRAARGAARALHARRRGRRGCQAAGTRRRDDAGPGRLGAGARQERRLGPQLRRRARDRRAGPPAAADKASKTLKAGEFTRARIVAADGHDLVAMPI
jgi:ribosomal protein S12 methylthiotransferase